MKRAWLFIACAWCCAAHGQAWLPDAKQVQHAIEAQPDVAAARARTDAAQAQARALRVGAHEVQVGVVGQVRNSDEPAGTQRYNEMEGNISRAFRWPNKVTLDRRIGEAGISAAELRLDDARHQSARRLLADWMALIRAADRLQAAQQQAELLQRERGSLARRVQLGDAARKDLDVLDVDVAQAQAQQLAAQAALQMARDALQRDFPTLAVPERAPVVQQPGVLPETPAAWVARIIERSHEIGAIEADAQQADAKAARARADRMPDPSLGLRTLRERSGAERAIGLTLSMPIGGRHRAALADAESAQAAALHGDAATMRRDISREAQATVANAVSTRAQWQAQQNALQASNAATQRLKRGWQLGELSLSDWLLAQRMQAQIAQAEAMARADAEEARLRVLVDSHELWHQE